MRRRIGIGDEPLILYVGRIASGKGIELLLDAVRRIGDAHLALVGPDDGHGVGAPLPPRKPRARQPDASTAWSLRPARSSLYADADVFVLPSAGESFGMVAAEAAAAGTPVIVSGPLRRCRRLGPDGALVVPYDADAVHRSDRACAARRILRDRLSTGGRNVAAALSWNVIVDRQEQIYREVIASAK